MLLLASSVIFANCNDKDPEPQPTPGTEPTDTSQISKNLLAKTEVTFGSQTVTKQYRYDAQNRLVWYSNTSNDANYFEDTSSIVRAADGHIMQIIYKSDTSRKYPDPKLDSVINTVNYDAGTSKYINKILEYKSYYFPFKDSTAYTYDGSNHITKAETWYYDFKAKTYKQSSKMEYTYDGNGDMTNLGVIYYKFDNVNDYPYQIVYTYDPKGVNLLNLGNEAILLGLEQDFSAHTPLTWVGTYPLNPEFNRSVTYKYTYNTKYRPLTATLTDAATSTTGTAKYTYQ